MEIDGYSLNGLWRGAIPAPVVITMEVHCEAHSRDRGAVH